MMKNLIACAGLLAATAGGVAFVLANQPAPAERGKATPASKAADPVAGDVPCSHCRAAVYDVTDLSTQFAAKRPDAGEFISFDEPPLAKKSAESREVLPPPREVKD